MRYTRFFGTIVVPFLLFTLPLSGSLPTISQMDETPVKNVIIMIGDGMGFEHVRYGSLIEYGIQDGLSFQSELFTHNQIWTSSANDQVTDSAASATSIATGVKTRNGYLGIDLSKTPQQTILEYAETLGKSTGVMTTTEFNHGTPGGFVSHVDNRDDWDLINADLYENDLEVVLGGGGIQIKTDTLSATEAIEMYDYHHITTKAELLNLDASTIDKLLGTFTDVEFDYEGNLDPEDDVHFAEMVMPALNILQKNDNGFFVMMEEGHIDKAGHAAFTTGPRNNPLETIEFDEGVKLVMDWMESNPDTLLIITADHETGGLELFNWDNLDDDLPSNYENEEDKKQRRIERTDQVNFRFTTSGHTGVPVPLHLYGKNADLLVSDDCYYNNAHVFQIMKNAIDGTYPTECPDWIPGFEETSDGPPGSIILYDYISDPITPATDSNLESNNSNESDSPSFSFIIILALIPVTLKVRNLMTSNKNKD